MKLSSIPLPKQAQITVAMQDSLKGTMSDLAAKGLVKIALKDIDLLDDSAPEKLEKDLSKKLKAGIKSFYSTWGDEMLDTLTDRLVKAAMPFISIK